MKFLKTLTTSALILLAGCTTPQLVKKQIPKNIFIDNSYYIMRDNTLTQKSQGNKQIRFGVVSDIHGEGEKARKIAQNFSNQNLDAILIAGDISRHFLDKKNIPESKEIKDSLIPFLETGKPVYVIAGNHESKNIYFKTISELSQKYNNLFDLATLDYVDLQGVNIFGVSGGTFNASNGFNIKKKIKSIDDTVFNLDSDPVLMISHMPAKFNHVEAIDEIYSIQIGKKKITDRHKAEKLIYQGNEFIKFNFKHSGLKELTNLIKNKNISFSVSGHYHMNRGANNLYENILEDINSSNLFMSPGAAQYDMAGILTIKDNQAKYELLKIK